MNPEQLITQAGVAMEKFLKEHNRGCVLYIKDGCVRCKTMTSENRINKPCLCVFHWDQKHGLTNARWNAIGSELFNLYNKDQLCHEHQKH